MSSLAAAVPGMEGIRSATVRAYLLEMPQEDRESILRSKQKIQELEQRVEKAQQTLGTRLLNEVDARFRSSTMIA